MEDEDNAPNAYLQLIQSVWAESRACWYNTILEYSVLARLSAHIPTGSSACTYLAQYPRLPYRYNLFIYSVHGLCSLHILLLLSIYISYILSIYVYILPTEVTAAENLLSRNPPVICAKNPHLFPGN